MANLNVSDAEELVSRLQARGIVIVAFVDDGSFSVVEHGRSKSDCTALLKWIDLLADGMEDGTIPAPWEDTDDA